MIDDHLVGCAGGSLIYTNFADKCGPGGEGSVDLDPVGRARGCLVNANLADEVRPGGDSGGDIKVPNVLCASRKWSLE